MYSHSYIVFLFGIIGALLHGAPLLNVLQAGVKQAIFHFSE